MAHECPTCGKLFGGDVGMKIHHTKMHDESITGGDVECHYCGTDMSVCPSRLENAENVFCTRACRGRWWGENRNGSDHPDWEGGQEVYGEGWTEGRRRRVRERQNFRCAGCGVHQAECPTRLPVHHIQPARSFDDPEARNAKSNLVALCDSCHDEWEQMAPLRPDTRHMPIAAAD